MKQLKYPTNYWPLVKPIVNENIALLNLHSIWTISFAIDRAGFFNKTQFIHHIGQILKAEVCIVLYENSTIPKDRLMFFEAVVQAKSSIHLRYRSVLQPTWTAAKNSDKSIEATNSHLSTANTFLSINHWGDFWEQSRERDNYIESRFLSSNT